ncbi:MAG: peptidyl-tRNA hydrolase Pth2 [Candidatus Aenigmarchaeota archaeon]|nr:peptidyl-tRNA hydrolase Pth2 [Candidatus Aenigmarchaeota archaeon]MDI6722470.1 peptidyl-tRNA hydrolase Pth2 [Candidatus Aenigmarchaeota archaeon]
MKQVIVVRDDLKMSCGKIAAQCSHASVSAVLRSKKKNTDEWAKEGQKKVILSVSCEKDIMELKQKCDKHGVVSCIIEDAGFTELEPGTITAIGIGPDDEKKIDKITGSLKLLK